MTELELLTAIYRHLRMDELLRTTGVKREEVDELFRTLKSFLQKRASDGERRAVLVMYLDGSAKGNPGPAGIGVVTIDAQGDVLEEFSAPLEEMTNNAAEYHALIAAIGRALEWKARQVTFRTDSELLAKQMLGQYRIKSRNLMSLCIEARNLLKRLPSWKLELIPREQNKRADHLASLAAQQAADERTTR